VILIASALRLFQLGHDGLWVDEINVAQAAVQPTVKEAVNVFRNHVMPMPFDYIIAWLVARVSIEESALRLPAAIWGILAVAVSYLLYKRLSNREMALIGALLLAVSPMHLHYSQELRFYSALIFFFYYPIYCY